MWRILWKVAINGAILLLVVVLMDDVVGKSNAVFIFRKYA